MAMILAAASIFANGDEENDYGLGNGQGRGSGRGAGGQGFYSRGSGLYPEERFDDSLSASINSDALAGLNDREIEWLKFMAEEEKLARDVYQALYESWNYPVFSNIAKSEQQHMDSVISALDASGERMEVLPAGEFSNPELSALYNKLVSEGKNSLVSAFTTGAAIEDLDISDLQKAVAESENDTLKVLYQNLMKGSRNHLRSFTAQLERVDADYTAQYISNEYYEKVITINREYEPITDPDYQFYN